MVSRRTLVKTGLSAVLPVSLPHSARAAVTTRVQYGALTLAKQGGLPLPTGTGALKTPAPDGSKNDLFEINQSGMVVPSSNLDAPGDNVSHFGDIIFDNGDVWQVHAVPKAYSCATGELSAILESVPATALDGKTILGRHNADLCGSNPGSKVVFSVELPTAAVDEIHASVPPAKGLRITTEDEFNKAGTLVRASSEKRCNMRRADFKHTGLIKFDNITVSDKFVADQDIYRASRIWNLINGSVGRPQMIVSECDFFNLDVVDFEGLIGGNKIHFSGKADALSGDQVKLFDTSGSKPQNIDGIPGDGTFTLALRLRAKSGKSYAVLQQRPISGVSGNTVTTMVKSKKAYLRKDNPDVEFIICKTVELLRGFGQTGGIKQYPDTKIENCTFSSCERGFTGVFNSLTIRNCVFDNNYADNVSIGLEGTERMLNIINNRFYRAGGTVTDLFNPHVDNIQFVASPMKVSNTVPYRVIGNIMWSKGGRDHYPQGIFIEGTNRSNPGADIRILVEIKHNVILTKSGQGIIVVRPASGSTIQGNTLLQDQYPAPQFKTLAGISTKSFKTDNKAGKLNKAKDDGVVVSHNICPYIAYDALSPKIVGSLAKKNKLFGDKLGANTDAAYTRILQGPTFDSEKIGEPNKVGDIEALLAAITPKPNTLIDSDGIKIGANRGYFDYKSGEETTAVPY